MDEEEEEEEEEEGEGEGEEEMEEGSFLEMLGSGEDEGGHLLCLPGALSSPPPPPPPPPPSSSYSSRMLYFGGHVDPGEALIPFHALLQQKSTDSSSISSLSSSPPPTSTTTATTTTSSSKPSKKKVDGSGGRRTSATYNTPNSVITSKKPKTEASGGHGTLIKVRKEKLGERIMALQQLVSPFGKSDTASVLHEALGYIRFLHDQVQVLSSPYLQRLPSSAYQHEGIGAGDQPRAGDLRSRGLCLVPISCTEHVANTNGADLWSPAMGKTKSSKH
ncbi:transcription factor bHLH113 isoform X2 [Ananas comosus]|uniref:Transcription factor bHLH113 isoform X2 n=1 Tax=Ananas comosus TaxID=4615 RepID=A0A6P5FEQ8_ANACO|nr:transcription factor bHLH113 isoform X2 [Ananas comosus]